MPGIYVQDVGCCRATSLFLPAVECLIVYRQSPVMDRIVTTSTDRDHVSFIMRSVDMPLANVVEIYKRVWTAWVGTLPTGFPQQRPLLLR